VKVDDAALDHRRFWDAMEVLSAVDLRVIETSVYGGMVDRYGLALDMSNFTAYIDSTDERAPIAARGKAKRKRTDLRLVGLAVVATGDGGIPIVSHPYAGDRRDVTEFSTVLDDLVDRCRLLVKQFGALTVVYDADRHLPACGHEPQQQVRSAAVGGRRARLSDRSEQMWLNLRTGTLAPAGTGWVGVDQAGAVADAAAVVLVHDMHRQMDPRDASRPALRPQVAVPRSADRLSGSRSCSPAMRWARRPAGRAS
jgi:hypothetical protein